MSIFCKAASGQLSVNLCVPVNSLVDSPDVTCHTRFFGAVAWILCQPESNSGVPWSFLLYPGLEDLYLCRARQKLVRLQGNWRWANRCQSLTLNWAKVHHPSNICFLNPEKEKTCCFSFLCSHQGMILSLYVRLFPGSEESPDF